MGVIKHELVLEKDKELRHLREVSVAEDIDTQYVRSVTQ